MALNQMDTATLVLKIHVSDVCIYICFKLPELEVRRTAVACGTAVTPLIDTFGPRRFDIRPHGLEVLGMGFGCSWDWSTCAIGGKLLPHA
jgi:hypothetical protein